MSKINLFLFAAPRSGSTQLAKWLASNRDIGCTLVKEPNFFSECDFPSEYVEKENLNDVNPSKLKNFKKYSSRSIQFSIFRNELDYERLVSWIDEKYKMDASTSYLNSQFALNKILQYNSDAKFIVLLRNPLERMVSHYRLALRTGRENFTFRERIQKECLVDEPPHQKYLIRYSKYFDSVKNLLEKVNINNVHFVYFEDMIKDPEFTLTQVASFLNVENQFDLELDEKNEGISPRFKLLNTWLQKSGIKTFLREILSKKLKRRLKIFYFSNKKIAVNLSGCETYLNGIAEDAKKLCAILPEVKDKWVLELRGYKHDDKKE